MASKYTLDIKNDDLLALFDDQFSIESFKKMISEKTDESSKVINVIEKVATNEESDDVKLVVDLTDEMKESYKKGDLKLDVRKDGTMYAQLKRDDGKYGEKLSIKEDLNENGISAADARFATELNAIKDQLEKMVEALEDIESYVIDTLQGLHNDRIGLFYSGLSTYMEASQMPDSDLRTLLIAQSIKSINDSQSQMIQELKYDVNYLINGEAKKDRRKHNQEKIDNIHKCFEVIFRATFLKAMIYFDSKQIASTLMVFEEYARFIETLIKPHAAFLIECDHREDKLINGIWEKRSQSFLDCKELKNKLINNNTFYITMEDK